MLVGICILHRSCSSSLKIFYLRISSSGRRTIFYRSLIPSIRLDRKRFVWIKIDESKPSFTTSAFRVRCIVFVRKSIFLVNSYFIQRGRIASLPPSPSPSLSRALSICLKFRIRTETINYFSSINNLTVIGFLDRDRWIIQFGTLLWSSRRRCRRYSRRFDETRTILSR